jgi:hypothetical protein
MRQLRGAVELAHHQLQRRHSTRKLPPGLQTMSNAIIIAMSIDAIVTSTAVGSGG